jgi:hypothetical protein
VIDKGYDSEQRDARHLLEQRRRWVEKREIPAELVQDEAADSSLRFLADQRPRPVEMGEGAAAVDVGDDDDGSVRELRDSQIGDVDLAKVDLGGTAKRSGLSMSPLSAGTTATSSVLKPARLRGKLGCRVATMTGTVAIWRKCDIDPVGTHTLKVTTDIYSHGNRARARAPRHRHGGAFPVSRPGPRHSYSTRSLARLQGSSRRRPTVGA